MTTRHKHAVRQIMGMPILLDVFDEDVGEVVLERAFDWLSTIDRIFSTYKDDSEISRLNRGELTLAQCSPAVRSVLARCERLRVDTGGYFDAFAAAAAPGAPRGCQGSGAEDRAPVDPSGLVKGWAVDGVAALFERAGAKAYCAEAAGDMVTRGNPDGATSWRVGVQHPTHPDALATVLSVRKAVVATSGAYARGAHIVDPATGTAPTGVLSVTVVGATDLARADAYATAMYAMGPSGAEWAAQHIAPYEAMVIFEDQTVTCTRGMQRWLA